MVLIQGKDPYFLIIHVQSKCACYIQLCKYFMGQGLPKWLESEKVKSLSHVWLFATPWTVAYQAPPSMGFSRQECWSGLPFLTQESNSGLPHCRQMLYRLSHQGSPMAQWLKKKKIHLPMQETQATQVRSLGREDPLEKGMATHSSILA